jgi:RNA recognition motif-containing protein
MRIFVGNLPWSTTEDEWQRLFERYGLVDYVRIVPASMGSGARVGFVEMPETTEAQAAIAGLQGTVLGAQQVTIREARPQQAKLWLSPALIKRLRVLGRTRSSGTLHAARSPHIWLSLCAFHSA